MHLLIQKSIIYIHRKAIFRDFPCSLYIRKPTQLNWQIQSLGDRSPSNSEYWTVTLTYKINEQCLIIIYPLILTSSNAVIRIYRYFKWRKYSKSGFFISLMCLHMLLKLESAGKICNFSILQVKFNKFVI